MEALTVILEHTALTVSHTNVQVVAAPVVVEEVSSGRFDDDGTRSLGGTHEGVRHSEGRGNERFNGEVSTTEVTGGRQREAEETTFTVLVAHDARIKVHLYLLE